jgi:hypothetical protein
MTSATIMQSTFAGGVWSPLLWGRADMEQYGESVPALSNFRIRKYGGLERRTGTRFLARTKNADAAARLVRFEFNTEQAYILEMGDQYIRFFRDRGQILEAGVSISGATQADPVVITANAHGYSNGDEVNITGVAGMTRLNGRNFLVANTTTNTFEITDLDGSAIDGTGFGAYSSGGSVARVYELATPYLQADLFRLYFAQSADVLYIVHPGYAPRKLTRTGHTSWTISEIDYQDGPYLAVNTTATTLTPSGTSGSVTVTASATTGINDGDGFLATDVGRLIRFKDASNNWRWLKITARASTTSVTATVQGDALSATTASSDWRLGAWSETTGFPQTITFFEERLTHGGCTNQPQTIWASKSGDFENMAPSDPDETVLDDSGFTYTISDDQVNSIVWLNPGKVLAIGTTGGEFTMGGSTGTDPLTPTNVLVKRETTYGSAPVNPLRIGPVVLYVQRLQARVLEFVYNFNVDQYISPDLSLLSEHLFAEGIVDATHQSEPDGVVYTVQGDGSLAALTYDRDQKVRGWWPITLGGSDVAVDSVASVPATMEDDVYVSVSRTIGGNTVRFVEVFDSAFRPSRAGVGLVDAYFVDAGLSYSGAAVSAVSGLDHLEGQTLAVLADGAVHRPVVVSDGAITLDFPASKIHAGLPFSSLVQMHRLANTAAYGTTFGLVGTVYEVTVQFHESLGGKIGPSVGNLEVIPFRSDGDLMDAPPSLFSGLRSFVFDGQADRDRFITILQEQPLPMSILSITVRTTSDAG